MTYSQRHLTCCLISCLGTGGLFAILFESWMVTAGVPYGTSGLAVGGGFAVVLLVGVGMLMRNNDREREDEQKRRDRQDYVLRQNAVFDSKYPPIRSPWSS